jgi:hypothetical protein
MSSSPIESSPPMTTEEYERIMRDFSDHDKVTDDDIMALKKLFTKYFPSHSAEDITVRNINPLMLPKCFIPVGFQIPDTPCKGTSKREEGFEIFVIALPGRSQDPVQFLECFKEFPSQFSDLSFSIAIASMGIDVSKYKEIPKLEVQNRGKGSYKVLTGPEFAIIITDNQFVQVLPRISKTIIIEGGSR